MANPSNAGADIDPLDIQHMRRCLELAAQAEGRTAPNPMVGAVVLDESGAVVGQGYHERAGEAHAEVVAFAQAGERSSGGTLYVNLEPCSHFGRTPPCVEAVIASGVKRVVAAIQDPNPKVAGTGFQKLKDAGIELVTGVLCQEATWLNRGFIKVKTTGRPWLCLKIAATLDGRVADRFGKSQWITGPRARMFVHQIRNRLDCVLVGAGTARTDNPTLNVREVENSRNPKRVLVDTNLTIDPRSNLCSDSTGGDTIIFCTTAAIVERGSLYPSHVRLVPSDVMNVLDHLFSTSTDEPFDRSQLERMDLRAVLVNLAELFDITTVLCEGGSRIAGNLIENDLVDELYWIVSPTKLLADQASKPALEAWAPVELNSIHNWKLLETLQLGDDTAFHLTSRES